MTAAVHTLLRAPARRHLPYGRHVELPDRGTTFVREVQGPPGAPTVLLLHGLVASGGLNWFQVFEPLAEHFNIIAPDLRGHAPRPADTSHLPALGLRRRLRRDTSRDGRRARHRGRLLDGWARRPAPVAPSPRSRRWHGLVRDERRFRAGPVDAPELSGHDARGRVPRPGRHGDEHGPARAAAHRFRPTVGPSGVGGRRDAPARLADDHRSSPFAQHVSRVLDPRRRRTDRGGLHHPRSWCVAVAPARGR